MVKMIVIFIWNTYIRRWNMNDRKLLGKIGEDLAASMLFAEGYSVIDRNFRSYVGEIDIVAMKDGTIYFVEVKTRTCEKFGEPGEAVNQEKQYRLRKTAEYYMIKHGDELCTYKDIETAHGIVKVRTEPDVMFKVVEIAVRVTDDAFLS